MVSFKNMVGTGKGIKKLLNLLQSCKSYGRSCVFECPWRQFKNVATFKNIKETIKESNKS
jgi:hypothetical protein